METKFKLKQSVMRLVDLKEYLDAKHGTCALPEVNRILSMRPYGLDGIIVRYEITHYVGGYFDRDLIALEDAPRYLELYWLAKQALILHSSRRAIRSLAIRATSCKRAVLDAIS